MFDACVPRSIFSAEIDIDIDMHAPIVLFINRKAPIVVYGYVSRAIPPRGRGD
jgi:hypothetical protein